MLRENKSIIDCQVLTAAGFEVFFAIRKRVRPFYYDGVNYCPIMSRSGVGVTETGAGVRITSLERTVVDCIAKFEKKSSASKTYLYEGQEGFVLHERWKLFAPEDLRAIIDKGVTDYDAV